MAGIVLFGLGAALCGCSGSYYQRRADRDAYAVVAQKTPRVPGMKTGFQLTSAQPESAASQSAKLKVVSLAQAIEIAETYNRDYQSRREDIYLVALDLAYSRYLWTPILSGVLNAAWNHSEPGDATTESGSSRFSVSQLLWTGGQASLSLATNFFRSLSGTPNQTASSLLSFAATQHLWRGAGVSIAMENLTQAERSMIYTLRSYVRFQRDFDVSIASSYYGILQQRDLIENVRLDMEGKTTAADRAQMMAEAGRIPDYQVGQARQEELNAKDSYIIAVESYERQLDAFKIQLGLPVDAPLALDPAELSKLAEQEIPKPTHTSEEATRLALALRLDLATAADDVADSERKVKVAKDNLNPGVDLLLNAAIGTEAPSKALSFTKDNSSVGYGVSVDLPLNQVAQRNAYVASLISVDRSKRALDQTRDQIRLQINDDLRRLEQARQSYDIQKISLQLAERQVDNERMLLEAGRVAMRDLLDAQNALLGARNGLTRTLLEHRMALLQLWRDMEVLTFKNGQFTEEIPNDNQRNG